MISKIMHPFQDNANSLITRTLYTHQIISFFIMWDYVCLFLCAGEVAKRGVFDSYIKWRFSIFT